MCDTIAAAPSATADGSVLFAKNSDREPGEAQRVEVHPGTTDRSPSEIRCTWMSIPAPKRVFRTAICRPFWGWGAEMGANECGVAIGNQAVFTRFPVAETGLTGMDLVRIALRRAADADEALETIVDHIDRFGQGGRCGYRHTDFRYHSSFAIADPKRVWILETAGPFWAARRVRSVWSLSNALTIGTDFDRISDGAVEYARRKGWAEEGEPFDFADAFGKTSMDVLAGARLRRRCTLERIEPSVGTLRAGDMMDALRSHGGEDPRGGFRMRTPCAHASWMPTRTSGQTVGSMVSRLDGDENVHWVTGTSAPCVSVFKPLRLDGPAAETGPAPGERYDPESLFWRHERLHRKVLLRGFDSVDAFDTERRELQARALQTGATEGGSHSVWEEHRERVADWAGRISVSRWSAGGPFSMYWKYQNWLDGVDL